MSRWLYNSPENNADRAERRAGALQARVAELEDENSQMYSAGLNQGERLDAAESELATAKARVAELEAATPHNGDGSCDACGSAPAVKVSRCHACESELADLRGRVERADALLSHALEVDLEPQAALGRAARALEALRGR